MTMNIICNGEIQTDKIQVYLQAYMHLTIFTAAVWRRGLRCAAHKYPSEPSLASSSSRWHEIICLNIVETQIHKWKYKNTQIQIHKYAAHKYPSEPSLASSSSRWHEIARPACCCCSKRNLSDTNASVVDFLKYDLNQNPNAYVCLQTRAHNLWNFGCRAITINGIW